MHPILLSNGYLRYRPYVSSKTTSRPKKNGRFRNWMRVGWEKWTHRTMIATLNALDDRTLKDIGIPRSHIKRFADNLCGAETQFTTPTAPPGER